jgi:glycine/D-amino acid oxidase-like deaminating enzyme
MPFIGGRVVGATAAAAAGAAGAVCDAAKPEMPATSANNAKQRSARREDGILLVAREDRNLLVENLLSDMGEFLSALA